MSRTPHHSWERAVEACVDGELSPVQDEAVRRHLDNCPDCDDHASFLMALRHSLRRAVTRLPALSRGRLERLAEHFHEPTRSAE